MQNNNILFSIITCTKNSELFLQDNINSVSSQTFLNYEHILIDGYSEDKTISIIEKYQQTNDNIVFHQYQPQGISHAMNQGVKLAKGKYIIHLHSDDKLHNINVLQEVASFLKNNPEIDWIYGQINTINEQKNTHGIFPKYRILQSSLHFLLKLFNYIPHQAVFIKKNVFDKFGHFDSQYKYCMDYDFWLKIQNKTNWCFFKKIVTDYKMHEKGMSSNPDNANKVKSEYLLIQKKYNRKIIFPLLKIINSIIQ